jgi:hypothetical protein
VPKVSTKLNIIGSKDIRKELNIISRNIGIDDCGGK